MLSKDLERALNESFKQARAQRHEFITVEHLLLALLDDPAALKVLSACGANVEALRGDLAEFIDATTPMVSGEDEVDTQPTLGFQRVLQRAVFHVQSSGKAEVTGANVLVAIFSEQESGRSTSSRRRISHDSISLITLHTASANQRERKTVLAMNSRRVEIPRTLLMKRKAHLRSTQPT